MDQGGAIEAAENQFSGNGEIGILYNNVVNDGFRYHVLQGEPQSSSFFPTIVEETGQLGTGVPEVVDDPQFQNSPVCGSSVSPGPENLTPIDCDTDGSEQALKDRIAELEIRRAEVEDDLSLTFAVKEYLLSEMDKCMQNLKFQLMLLFAGPKRFQDAIDYFATDDFTMKIQVYGMLVNANLYESAETYLNNLFPMSQDERDFVTVQDINLTRLKGGTRVVSPSDSLTLYQIGNKLHPLSGYARSLYFTTTGDRIILAEPAASKSVYYKPNVIVTTDQSVTLSPNPVSGGLLTVTLNKPYEHLVDIFVVDISGRILKQVQLEQGIKQTIIELEGLSDGMYLIHAVNQKDNKTLWPLRVVVQ
jgi:hypothetical protein